MTNADIDTSQVRVALLIDADNIDDQHADAIFKDAAEMGNVIVRRGYGGMPFPWKKEKVLRYAIEPVARFVNVPRKNVTDIALIIHALELAYQKVVDVICIASNDSDFSLLAMKLRELGIKVYGFGNSHAQKSFVYSCDSFVRLVSEDPKQGTLQQADSEEIVLPEPETIQTMEEVENLLKEACSRCEDDNGWAQIIKVVNYIRRLHPDFSPQDYGHEKFSLLIKATGCFDYDDKIPTIHKIKIKEKNGNK